MSSVKVARTTFDGRSARGVMDVAGDRVEISLEANRRFRRPVAFGDVWLPLAIFPAMRLGVPVELADPVSSKRLEGVLEAQRVLAAWDDTLTPQAVRAPVTRRAPLRRRPPIQLMTGGVDSSFTLLEHPETVDLLYMHDVLHEPPAVRERVDQQLDSMARALRRRVTKVDSDIRRVLDPYAEWGSQTHGAALVAAASLVAEGRRTLYVAGSHHYSDLEPWGSHPVLDHLYSSGTLRVVHSGAHATRPEKVRAVARDAVLTAHLRVCWRSTDALNCGRCEKCLRTMVALELAGALGTATTFDVPLSLDALRTIEIANESERVFVLENIRAARSAGRDDIAEALAVAVGASP